jgi:hypothetical protein
MIRFTLTIVLVLWCTIPLCAVTITDGTFSPGDWTAAKIWDSTVGSAAWYSTDQITNGGNPGAYASTTLHYYISSENRSQGIIVAQLCNEAVYNPTVQGAISTIDYSYDGRLVDQNWFTGVFVAPILMQDSIYYTSNAWVSQPSSWSRQEAFGLVAASFTNWLGNNPDFSSTGSTIHFGYLVSSAGIYQPTASVNVTAGVDNWSVTITSVPDLFTWKGPGGGGYNLTSNWTSNIIPDGVDSTANFSGTITEPSTVTLDSPVTLGTLIFNSDQSYTLAGTGSVILQVSSGTASINVQAGSHEISVPMIMSSDTTITGAGTLDLSGGISGNHALTVLGNLTATSIEVDALTIGTNVAMAVPEPSTFTLLTIAFIASLAFKRQRRRLK